MKRILMFDLDGTIIDTMNIYAEFASKLIEKETGLNKNYVKKVYLDTAGMDFYSQLKIMSIDERKRGKIYTEFIERKDKLLSKTSLPENVKDFIIKLREIGFKTILSTNNECRVVKKIEGINVFDEVLCFDGKGMRKGKPHLNYVKIRYKARADEILFIGDSTYDLIIYSKHNIETVKTRGLFREDETERIYRIIRKRAFKKI